MKRIIICKILFVISLLISSQASSHSSFVAIHGKLSVEGTSLIDQNKREIALKGVSLGWHNWWEKYYNEQTISWLQSDWKCNLVRAAIGVDPEGAYIDNPEEALSSLYEIIDATIKNGMYVIVDWHSHTTKTEEAKAFFTAVALKYKDYPNVIYEIFNEPENQSWQEVKTYAIELIKAIRAIDSDNIILIGSPHWDQDVDIVADDPIIGYNNIMYTLHFYAATHGKELRDKANYALDNGIPLFVSECASMEASGDGDIDLEEWNNWLEWMTEKGISWVAWSISDKDESCSMIKDDSSPVSHWKDKDLKKWGKIARNLLKNQTK